MMAGAESLADIQAEPHDHLPSEREKEAMAILYEEGWTSRELAMVFEIRHETVLNYVDQQGVSR